jgi:hypothetical protein
LKLLALVCAFWCLAASAAADAAASTGNLTAHEILSRARKAWGGTAQSSQMTALEASVTSRGLTQIVRIFTKAPNRVFFQRIVPWMHVVVQGGYNGRVAWSQVNLGGAGPSAPAEERFIRTQAALNNSAEVIPGRWPMRSYRLPNATIRGKTYLRVYVEPRGGNASTLLIDPKTYDTRGRQYALDRYDICTQYVRTGGVTNCQKEDIYQGGRLVGTSVSRSISAKSIDDALFEMPTMPFDWTTRWILERYQRALREPLVARGTALVGLAYFRSYLNDRPYSWSTLHLQTTPPVGFEYTLTSGSRTFFRSGYDGVAGFVEHNGRGVAGVDNIAIWGMLYNRCELHAQACNVHIERQPNVSLAARQYYALTVVSNSNSSQWYTVLLDEQTYLPAAIWTGDMLVYLSDYRPLQSGELRPRRWTLDSFSYQEIITNVAPAAPSR